MFLISLKISPILYSMVFGAGGRLLELLQVGEERIVDEVGEVVASHGLLVVDRLAVGLLRRGPRVPAVGLGQDVVVLLAVQLGLGGFVLLEAVEVFEEQQPGGLLGVIELGGAAGFFAEGIVDVPEGLFEHVGPACS